LKWTALGILIKNRQLKVDEGSNKVEISQEITSFFKEHPNTLGKIDLNRVMSTFHGTKDLSEIIDQVEQKENKN
jgi:hypothetical protein